MMVDVVDINTPGWEGVNAASPAPPPQSDTEQGELDRAINRIFQTDDGARMLAWLEDAYLSQPSWAPGFDTDYGFFREGQNTLIREMILRAERAKEWQTK
jgi:hypothetical protein